MKHIGKYLLVVLASVILLRLSVDLFIAEYKVLYAIMTISGLAVYRHGLNYIDKLK